MSEFDLVIRGGTVVTAADTFRADVGVRDGRIAALGEKLDGAQVLDAGGLLVLPGGVATPCHIEQLRPTGGADEERLFTGRTALLRRSSRPAPSATRGPSIIGALRRRWSITASTRSSPIHRMQSCATKFPRWSHQACAA